MQEDKVGNRFRFRAWDKSKPLMFYDIQDAYDGYRDLPEDSFGLFLGRENFCRNPISEYVIMQSTGLLDKNGKEIFEGDLVSGYGGKISAVIWRIDYVLDLSGWVLDPVGVKGVPGGTPFHTNLLPMTDLRARKASIIGNIYENPELKTSRNNLTP